MAGGRPSKRSFQEAFDTDELYCEPCINSENWVTVTDYCQTCQEYMCASCPHVHKKQELSRFISALDKKPISMFAKPRRHESPQPIPVLANPRHESPKPISVLTKPRRNESPKPIPVLENSRRHESPNICTVYCKTHQSEIVRYYCKDHNEPGCLKCMTLNHKSCHKERVQDISDSFQATEEFDQVHQNLDKFHEELKTMKETLELDLNNLETEHNKVQKNVTKFRKHINDYLDQIQTQITDEAAKKRKELKTPITIMIAQNQAMKSELDERIQTLKVKSDLNSTFIHTKQAKQRLATMEKELNTMKATKHKQIHYTFYPNPKIQSILFAKAPMGKLSSTPNIHMGTSIPKMALGKLLSTAPNKTIAPKTRLPGEFKSAPKPNTAASIAPKKNLPGEIPSELSMHTTVSYRRKLQMKSCKDDYACWVHACTLLNENQMVIADEKNGKVRIIGTKCSLIYNSYSTSSMPYGVTSVNSGTVAVTLPDEAKIELLNVISQRISHQKYIDCSTKECHGIAYRDGKFAVAYYQSRVEIMDIEGNVLHTIQPKQVTDFYITFGHKADTIILSDYDANTVSVVTFEGQVLQAYTHEALSGLTGVALTANGELFICSEKNKCVHVVSPDFMRSKVIIKDDENVFKPVAIAYCNDMQRLYVSNFLKGNIGCNSLHVYDVKQL